MSDALEIAKKQIKLIDYIHGDKKSKGNWIFINPCPKCGHKDHFAIDKTKNIYVSFACGGGGTIIDYLIDIENYEKNDAIKKVLEMTGLDGKKITANEITKRKKQLIQEKKYNNMLKSNFNKLYHRLCILWKTLQQLIINEKNTDAFLIFLYNYFDAYIDVMRYNEYDYSLVQNFKKDFELAYNNFKTYERGFHCGA